MAIVKNHDIDVSKFSYDPLSGLVFRHFASSEPKPFGRVGKYGYLVGVIDGHEVQVHRLAWRLHFGVWPEVTIDHRDEDKVNNRIGNLREASDGENRLNTSTSIRNKTGFKGVYYRPKDSPTRPWMAMVIRNRKRHHLGYYATPEEASAAYDKGALKVHGEFARLHGKAPIPGTLTLRRAALGLRGVQEIKRPRTRKFKATIMHGGRQQFQGCHLTPEDAALAYDNAVRRLGSKRGINYLVTDLAHLGFYPPPPAGVIFDLGMVGMQELHRRRAEALAQAA